MMSATRIAAFLSGRAGPAEIRFDGRASPTLREEFHFVGSRSMPEFVGSPLMMDSKSDGGFSQVGPTPIEPTSLREHHTANHTSASRNYETKPVRHNPMTGNKMGRQSGASGGDQPK